MAKKKAVKFEYVNSLKEIEKLLGKINRLNDEAYCIGEQISDEVVYLASTIAEDIHNLKETK